MMSPEALGALLSDAVREAERDSPAVQPLLALNVARARGRQRRGHVAALAFVVFAVVLQAHPRPAFGDLPGADAAHSMAMERPGADASGPDHGLGLRG